MTEPAPTVSLDALFSRIRAAIPEPLKLSDGELALLDAWLRSNGRISVSDLQARARGADIPRLKWLEHLRFVRDFNRGLRKSKTSAAEGPAGGRTVPAAGDAAKKDALPAEDPRSRS